MFSKCSAETPTADWMRSSTRPTACANSGRCVRSRGVHQATSPRRAPRAISAPAPSTPPGRHAEPTASTIARASSAVVKLSSDTTHEPPQPCLDAVGGRSTRGCQCWPRELRRRWKVALRSAAFRHNGAPLTLYRRPSGPLSGAEGCCTLLSIWTAARSMSCAASVCSARVTRRLNR